MKQRIYIDTSVIGGYFDKEFESTSRELFEEVLQGEYKIVISSVTEGELEQAPEKVKTLLNDLKINYDLIKLTDEAVELATEYLS